MKVPSSAFRFVLAGLTLASAPTLSLAAPLLVTTTTGHLVFEVLEGHGATSNLEFGLGTPSTADLEVFRDRDNSLGLGGSIVETVGLDHWVLHLDDAASVDDDDNEMIIDVRVRPVPEPATLTLLVAGAAAAASRRRKRQVIPSRCS